MCCSELHVLLCSFSSACHHAFMIYFFILSLTHKATVYSILLIQCSKVSLSDGMSWDCAGTLIKVWAGSCVGWQALIVKACFTGLMFEDDRHSQGREKRESRNSDLSWWTILHWWSMWLGLHSPGVDKSVQGICLASFQHCIIPYFRGHLRTKHVRDFAKNTSSQTQSRPTGHSFKVVLQQCLHGP